MKKLSIILRMYIGFGFLCTIIIIWGAINWWMNEQMRDKVHSISKDAFYIQQEASAIATASLRAGKQIQSLTELTSTDDVEPHYQTAIKELRAIQVQLANLTTHARQFGHVQQLQTELNDLDSRV
ncbi:MAG: hypothetical protein P8Y45_17290 [Exilibacterium sp.]